MRSRLALATLSLVMLALPVRAGTMSDRCTAAKERAAARATSGLLGCEQHAGPIAACRTRVVAKLTAAFGRIEARGGCSTTGDAGTIGALLITQADALIAALTPTTTTTSVTVTTSTSCPPPTAFYCGTGGGNGSSSCGPFPPPLCPLGTTCDTGTCTCTGESIPCGDSRLSALASNFCQWGTCPTGMTCGAVPKTGACGFDCACH